METKSTLYNEFPLFLKRYFSYKVQKISLNAGFTCPNRDGNKGVGGCTYCNNQTFNPDYCRTEKSITRQLEEVSIFRFYSLFLFSLLSYCYLYGTKLVKNDIFYENGLLLFHSSCLISNGFS